MDKDWAQGTIIGQAVGDMLGFPVEGQPYSQCQKYVGNLDTTSVPKNRPGFESGQYTDDTQLSIELLTSLIEQSGFDDRDFADRIGCLFEQDHIVGRGMATSQAANRIIEGTPLDSTGTPAPSAGNGTAMRAAPIGLVYDDLEEIKKYSIAQSYITHQDARCSAGSVAIAYAVAHLRKIDKGDLAPKQFIESVASSISTISPIFSKSILQLHEMFEVNTLGAVRMISTWGEPDFLDGWKFISPYVIPSVCWSFYSFLTNPESYENAISASISAGGDVDTTAAMTGALSGAYLGVEAIPKTWVECIRDRNRHDITSIRELVDKIH